MYTHESFITDKPLNLTNLTQLSAVAISLDLGLKEKKDTGREEKIIEVSYLLIQRFSVKPSFHIVVSVVSVVRKNFIGQIQIYGNLPYKCSIQKKRQIQLAVRDRMNSICPMNFFRTTDTTDTTIWKPGLT